MDNPNEKKFVYVLRLEKQKYYVGSTTDLLPRLKEHTDGNKGSTWTSLYKPVFVERVIENADIYDEDKYTKIMMHPQTV